MAHYVLLMKYHSKGLIAAKGNPSYLLGIHDSIERWEAKVIESYRLLGEYDQCTIIDAPSNFMAYRATLAQELSTTAHTEILPAIDIPLFQRLMEQSGTTGGPHKWQIQPWAQLARRMMRNYAFTQWEDKYFKPFKVTGRHKVENINGPCIVVGNHASHLDQYALLGALPEKIRNNIYFGAAADRWFLKGRKDIKLQPWYQSLVMGLYPIKRGGGSATLEYPKWLLDQGRNLMLFPEGTRSRGRELAKFKHGVSILALDKKVPVVPIYMTGLKAMRPPGTKSIIPGPVTSHILDPIYFDYYTDVTEATQTIFQAMNHAHQQVLSGGDEAFTNL
ncbi:MAG: GYD domain-containing protein [Gammaproteobacteria bacterium]|nr:GYD domain-containing protein [Gammaproteobacteria bacterium]